MSPMFGKSPICVGCPTCGAAYGWACHDASGVPVANHEPRVKAYASAYPEDITESPELVMRALRAARTEGVRAERARIVTWLRSHQGGQDHRLADQIENEKL
jgi:hypothetical protein